jgi:hypothetical protein
LTLPKFQDAPAQRYKRNRPLARYIGISEMTLRRWKQDPALATPAPMLVNGIEYNDVPQWDAWLKARAVSRIAKAKAP